MNWDAIGAVATAGATIIALVIWLSDTRRRARERTATRRLLAQVMMTPVGTAQLQIAKFRSTVVPQDGSTSVVQELANSHNARNLFAGYAQLVKVDLPSQFVDKADLFGEATSNRLAYALSQVSRLHSVWSALGDLPDDADRHDIEQCLGVALLQIKESEEVIGEAFQALLMEGRASWKSQKR
ncbi:hypothetical protein VDG09_02215 [Xanthomonas campestris pv. raphani]|uniref:hypothetical protein n=1 Tax=Xanthomonas campestris TaxID=339 RepID=UPI002B229AC3|nr:hypothetical protein [Xanthomonas campestris]MEA9826484.1 hypothetical protein [Xanthomonas campestris pv. raphani]